MKYRKARLLVSNVLALSLLLLLIAGGGVGGGAKTAEAATDAWSIVTSPNPSSGNNYLFGVSLADSTHVWAVGSYLDSLYRTLVTKWNGNSWSQETSPNPLTGSNELYGVHARTTTDVWAVGNSTSGNVRPIILHRTSDATGWVSVTTPSASTDTLLRGVSAVSSNLAWAVGFAGLTPIIYKWNGTSWSSESISGSPTGQLRAVSAVSSTLAWAVGSTDVGNSGNTLILKWDGTNWSSVTSPSPGTSNNGLAGVKAISSNEAYAVGYYDSGSGSLTLALKWNGTSWSQETSANPHTTDRLEAVDAGGAQKWAVGESRTSPFRTLTLRRSSSTSTWNTVASPNNNSNNHFLHGVAVDPNAGNCTGGDIWAVGHYNSSGSNFNTLIMQYTVTSPCRGG